MPSIIQLHKVSLADIDELLTLSKNTFFTAFYHLNNAADMEAYAEKAFTRTKLQAEMETAGSVFYFARLDNETIGFIKLNTGNAQNEFQDQNSLEVERLYIAAPHQGKRYGEQMLQFAFEEARRQHADFIWLGVWEHNTNAIRFYERMGFVQYGSHEFMLGDDKQTDLLMRCPLAP